MLNRVWPMLLSVLLPWTPPGCSYDGDDDYPGAGGRHGYAGATNGGSVAHAGTSAAGASTGGASTGAAGTSTGGATGNGGVGTGGASTAGVGGSLQGSFSISPSFLQYEVCPPIAPVSFTITNTSSTALTWHVKDTGILSTLTPSGSTLAPGEAVDVSVNVQPLPGALGVQITIDADNAPEQIVTIVQDLTGPKLHQPAQPDIDFGEVPIVPLNGSSGATRMIQAVINNEILSPSQDPTFQLNGIIPALPGGQWQMRFNPHVLGPQELTFTFGTMSSPISGVCPPNTFKARGVGIAAP